MKNKLSFLAVLLLVAGVGAYFYVSTPSDENIEPTVQLEKEPSAQAVSESRVAEPAINSLKIVSTKSWGEHHYEVTADAVITNISPLSKKGLAFSLSALSNYDSTDSVFDNSAISVEANGEATYVSVVDSLTNTTRTNVVMALYPFDGKDSIESRLEDLQIQYIGNYQGITPKEEENYRTVCDLQTSIIDGVQTYRLQENQHAEKLMGAVGSPDNYCHSYKYYIVGNILIEDRKIPSDAGEPMVIPATLRLI